jgi:hypothetical protein
MLSSHLRDPRGPSALDSPVRAGRETHGDDARDPCEGGHVPRRHPRLEPVPFGGMGDDARSHGAECGKRSACTTAVLDDEIQSGVTIDPLVGRRENGRIVSFKTRDFGLLGKNENRGRDVEIGGRGSAR